MVAAAESNIVRTVGQFAASDVNNAASSALTWSVNFHLCQVLRSSATYPVDGKAGKHRGKDTSISDTR